MCKSVAFSGRHGTWDGELCVCGIISLLRYLTAYTPASDIAHTAWGSIRISDIQLADTLIDPFTAGSILVNAKRILHNATTNTFL